MRQIKPGDTIGIIGGGQLGRMMLFLPNKWDIG